MPILEQFLSFLDINILKIINNLTVFLKFNKNHNFLYQEHIKSHSISELKYLIPNKYRIFKNIYHMKTNL